MCGARLSLKLPRRIETRRGCRIGEASDSADWLIKVAREQEMDKGIL